MGLSCGQIKTGAPCRGERIAKYNQLLRIEAGNPIKTLPPRITPKRSVWRVRYSSLCPRPLMCAPVELGEEARYAGKDYRFIEWPESAL